MMEYPFFLYKEKAEAVFGFCRNAMHGFGRPTAPYPADGWPSADKLARCATIKPEELDAALECHPLLAALPFRALRQKRRTGPDGKSPELVGLTLEMHVRDRERLFAAVLDLAFRCGFSVVDPLFGVLLFSAAEEERRPGIWMKCRRQHMLGELTQCGGRQFFALPHAPADSFYVAVACGRYGKPSSASAIRFKEDIARCLWPGERLVPFEGRLVVEGPNGAYRFHFNWEGNGKHASWTADFREAACPIVPTHRSSMRLLRRTPSARSLVETGMAHPAVVERVPDPAERYTLLHFANRKLEKRLPRALVEELKTAVRCGDGSEKREGPT